MLTRRQMDCFEKNPTFNAEVAESLLPIASAMLRQSLVDQNNTALSETERQFALHRYRVAGQILSEQGINVASAGTPVGAQYATGSGGSSVAMRYLIQQMLLMPTWTLSPDDWAGNEAVGRAHITSNMTALLDAMTVIPE